MRLVLLLVVLGVLSPGVLLAAGTADDPIENEESLQHYTYGRVLEEQGDRARALDEYYHALKLSPRSMPIMRRISEVAGNMGDAGRSLEFAEKALAVDSTDTRSRWLQGTALLNLGRNREALVPLQRACQADSEKVEYFRTLAHAAEQLELYDLQARCERRVTWLDEDDPEAWFQLAAAETRQGHFAAADSALKTSAALNPMRPGLTLLQGWVSEGLQQWDKAIDAYGEHLRARANDQVTRRRRVMLLARQHRYPEAAAEANAVSRAHPTDVEARQVEAELLFQAGLAKDGERRIVQLLQEQPDNPDALAALVGVLAHHGRATQAVETADRWLADHPGHFQGLLITARARELRGDLGGAVERYRRAIAQAPDSIPPRSMLARAYEGAKKLGEAERVWSEAVAHFPRTEALRYDLALCREKLDDLPGAESAVRDVLEREPRNAVALNFLGYLFADHNRKLDEAVSLISRALAVDPDNGAYLDSLGWAYYRLGRLEEARFQLERALRMGGDDPVIHEHLGDVYKGLQLNQLARDQYLKSLSFDQANNRVKSKLSRIR